MKKNAAKLRKDKASRQQDRKKALKDKKVKSILGKLLHFHLLHILHRSRDDSFNLLRYITEEHEKKKQVDHTQSNIMYLKALGASSLPSEEAQSVSCLSFDLIADSYLLKKTKKHLGHINY